MKEDHLISMLSYLNYGLGILIGLISVASFLKYKSIVPMYIIFAIIIAGPLEDILVDAVKSSSGIPKYKKDKYIDLVDQSTSFGFLIFLLLAVIESIG